MIKMTTHFNMLIAYGMLAVFLIVGILGQPRSAGTAPYDSQSSGPVGGSNQGGTSGSQSGSSQGIGSVPVGSAPFIRSLPQNVGGSFVSTQTSGDRFGQDSTGPRFAAGSSGASYFDGAKYGSPKVSRVDAVFNPTVTQFVTLDRFVTLTDQAFQSVAVTLTSLTVQTVTAETRGVVQTPVDDRVALQTTVVVRPSTLTVTYVQSDFRLVTERALDYVTIAHTSYVILQTTYTTTATQVLSYTSTLVRTNINTQSTTFTDYRTITDTVLVQGSYYGNRQF